LSLFPDSPRQGSIIRSLTRYSGEQIEHMTSIANQWLRVFGYHPTAQHFPRPFQLEINRMRGVEEEVIEEVSTEDAKVVEFPAWERSVRKSTNSGEEALIMNHGELIRERNDRFGRLASRERKVRTKNDLEPLAVRRKND